MDNQQLSLPYEIIDKVANRDYLRVNFKRGAREVYQIPFKSLLIRDGFNQRIIYDDIEELAASIAVLNQLETPMTVDVLPDGRVFIEKGHKRYKAIEFNNTRGIVMEYVDCYVNPKEKTEQSRTEGIYTSNMNNSKLKSIEQANTIFALKHNFGKTSNEDIANRLGISRQKVDMLLLIAEAPDDIKDQIKHKTMGITEAVDLIRRSKREAKKTDQIEEDSHKTSGSPAPPRKDLLAEEIKDLDKLEKEISPEEQEEIAAKELEKLLEVSDEIKVREETLQQHIGRKLSADVVREWVHEYMEDGEPQSKDMSETLFLKNTILTEDAAKKIVENGEIDTVFLYKQGMEPVALSVITEPVAEKEKDKYDSDRPEIAQIQNVIKLADKIEAVVNKLDCAPEQTKIDLANYVKWLQKDAQEVREWVHKNKKQNKAR